MKLLPQKGIFIRLGIFRFLKNPPVCAVALCRRPPLLPLLLGEYPFCPTSDTLPWVIEPDMESQSGDALLNA